VLGVPQGFNPPEKLGKLRQIIDRMLKEEDQSSSIIIVGRSRDFRCRNGKYCNHTTESAKGYRDYLPARNLKLFPLATRSFNDLHLCKLRNVPESRRCIGHMHI